MSYLSFIGLLVFLAASVLALDSSPYQQRDPIVKAQTSDPWHHDYEDYLDKGANSQSRATLTDQQGDPIVKAQTSDPWHHDYEDYLDKGANSQSRATPTRFGKRVFRVLKNIGLLNPDNTAERVVKSLQNNTELLRKLKKLLDESQEEEEPEEPEDCYQ